MPELTGTHSLFIQVKGSKSCWWYISLSHYCAIQLRHVEAISVEPRNRGAHPWWDVLCCSIPVPVVAIWSHPFRATHIRGLSQSIFGLGATLTLTLCYLADFLARRSALRLATWAIRSAAAVNLP